MSNNDNINNVSGNEFYDILSDASPYSGMKFLDAVMGMRDINEPNHWKSLDFGKFNIIRPTLLCFPGNASTHASDANAFCKCAMGLIGLYSDGVDEIEKNVDIIGFAYGKKEEDSNNEELSSYEIEKIVKEMLLPLCVDKFGKLLSVDEIRVNLSNITFFSHCHGDMEVSMIMCTLNSKLYILGLSQEDIIRAFSEIRHVSYAPESDYTIVPTVKVFSKEDLRNYWRFGLNKQKRPLDIIYDERGITDGFGTSLADRITIYTEKLLNGVTKSYDEHSLKFLNRNKKWKIDNELASSSKNADIVSQMIGYSLARSVGASLQNYFSKGGEYIPKISLQELVVELEDIKNTYTIEELSPKQK